MAEPKLYKCGFCNEWSGQPEHATRAHMSWKHNICWSAAIPCTQKFGSRKELTKHWIQTSHCYYCYICDGGYQSKDLFAKHACTPRKDAIIGGIKCPVHRPATISCSYCHEKFCSHSDLFRHMEVACRYTNEDIIHELLLALGPNKTCAIPLDLDAPQRYFCLGCDRTFVDLGSLAAHIEHSRSCPADVKSKYFRKIVKTVDPPETYQLESLSVWG